MMQRREQDRPMLAEALRYREVVPPERAAANLPSFLNDPSAVVILRQFYFRIIGTVKKAYFYQFQGGTGPHASRYQVRAADGTGAGFAAELLSTEPSEPTAPKTETDYEVGEVFWIRAKLIGRIAASVRIRENGQRVQIQHGERLVAGVKVGAQSALRRTASGGK